MNAKNTLYKASNAAVLDLDFRRIRGTNGTALFVAPANLRTASNDSTYRLTKKQRAWRKSSAKAMAKLLSWVASIRRSKKPAYDFIFADPPWDYGSSKRVSTSVMMPHDVVYPVMCLEDICSMDVGGLAAKNAELWLWVPQSLVMDAMRVAAAWGFTVWVGTYCWDKRMHGASPSSVLPAHELLLRWRRGETLKHEKKVRRLLSCLSERRTGHSVKPSYWQDGIERLYPTANKLELFGRARRKGWTVWGNEM